MVRRRKNTIREVKEDEGVGGWERGGREDEKEEARGGGGNGRGGG